MAECEPTTPMIIDETAVKVIAEFNPIDNKIYGYSAMSQFVLIRDVPVDFDSESYFGSLSIRLDSKTNSKIC